MAILEQHTYTFGHWRIDLNERKLFKESKPVVLTDRAFDVLHQLVAAKGNLVTKDELLELVWRGVVVEENSLQAQISAIRKALGTDRAMLVTEFGRGYRFLSVSNALEDNAVKSCELPISQHEQTTLIGRNRATYELETLVKNYDLVTVTGTGGIGKTSLVIAVKKLLEESQTLVWLVELASLADDRMLKLAIANCFNLDSDIDQASSGDLRAISRLQGVLILDNCEHLIDGVARLVDLLRGIAPNLKIVTTSQEALRVSGEQLYKLSPLDETPAAALFLARSRAIKHDFSPSEEDQATIAAICCRLDGLPLAIELAAARLTSETVSEIHEGLSERFNCLVTGKRTSLARHRTLFATIEWSYNLLTTEEKQFFQRLSIFAKKFNKNLAGELFARFNLTKWQISNLLHGLVEKSLLQTETVANQTRYFFLESIRCYSMDLLQDTGELECLRRELAEVCCNETEKASIESLKLPSKVWQEKHSILLAEIRSTLDWSLHRPEHLHLGVQLLEHATPFWITFSLYDECRHYIEPLLDKNITISELQEMYLNSSLGKSLSWSKGPIVKTGQCWHKALESAEKFEDKETQLQACYGLWLYYLRSGDIQRSLDYADLMTKKADLFNDRDALETAKRIQGSSSLFLGELEQAQQRLSQSVEYFSKSRSSLPYRFGLDQLVAAQAFLSRTLWVLGQTVAAKQLASDSVSRAKELDHISSLCCALAEGECAVASLNKDYSSLRSLALELKETSSNSNLAFWKAYADIYLIWESVRGNQHSADLALVADKLNSIKLSNLHWSYTTLIVEIWSELNYKDQLEATLLTDNQLMDQYWAASMFLGIQASCLLTKGDLNLMRDKLNVAVDVAEEQGAKALLLRALISQYHSMHEQVESEAVLQKIEQCLESVDADKQNQYVLEAHKILAQRKG